MDRYVALVFVMALPAMRGAVEAAPVLTSGQWRFHPVPDVRRNATCMAIDEDDAPWIKAQGRLYYWDGNAFRAHDIDSTISLEHLVRVFGSPDRGAYAAAWRGRGSDGMIYRLSRGAATPITGCRIPGSGSRPPLYVSKSGHVYNWGIEFLSKFDGKTWTRVEAKLHPWSAHVFELGSQVYFYYHNALYCSGPAGIRKLDPPRWREESPARKAHLAAQWAGSKVVVAQQARRGLFAFDLLTCKEVSLEAASKRLEDVALWDLFSVHNGAVWIYGTPLSRPGHYEFFQLSTDGKLSEVPGTEQLARLHRWRRNYPESLLAASDGSMWFALRNDGIAIYRNGKLERYGWRYGLPGVVHFVREDSNGNAWLPMSAGIVRAGLAVRPKPVPHLVQEWSEIVIAEETRIWETQPGQIATVRADKPGHLSRWDGARWAFQRLPFDTDNISRLSLIDDRGHLLLTTRREGECYDIGPKEVVKYKDMRETISSAVAQGAREFPYTRELREVVATPEGRIWWGLWASSDTHYYDGKKWGFFKTAPRVFGIFRSVKHGVLFSAAGRKYYSFTGNELVEAPPGRDHVRGMLLGPKGLQPYERELLERYPGRYLPVRRTQDGLKLISAANDLERSVAGREVPGSFSQLKKHITRLDMSALGGPWYVPKGSSSDSPLRVFGRRLLSRERLGTPLEEKRLVEVKEDRAGRLWFQTGYYGRGQHVFIHEVPKIRVLIDDPPRDASRELRVTVRTIPSSARDDVCLFTRVNKPEWVPAELDGRKVVFRFLRSGQYRCEIIGLAQQMVLHPSTCLEVRADVPLPDTVLTEPVSQPVPIRGIGWVPKVRAVNTPEGKNVKLLWRIDDGAWRELESGYRRKLLFRNCAPGRRRLEFRTVEDEHWADPTPLSVEFDFRPDYEKILEDRLPALMATHPGAGSDEIREIIAAGSRMIPVLERRLGRTWFNARRKRILQWLIDSIKDDGRIHLAPPTRNRP